MLSLSIVIYLPVPTLWLWKLSILAVSLGHWFAFLSFAMICQLCVAVRSRLFSKKERALSTLFLIGLNSLTALLFLAPLVSVVSQTQHWENSLKQEFNPNRFNSPKAIRRPTVNLEKEPWLNWLKLIFPFFQTSSRIEPQTYIFSASSNLRLDFYPPAKGVRVLPDGAPWVLIVHGGAWSSGSRNQIPELNSHLAQQGYGVIAISYRFAPQYRSPAQLEDAVEAIQFTVAHAHEWGLDATRWGVIGRSAGAQIAGVVAYTWEDRKSEIAPPRAFISFYGPSDLVFGYEVGEEDDALKSRQTLRDYLGGSPYQFMKTYEDASLLNKIRRSSCPTLLFHGKLDALVWYRHSERLFERLKMFGVPSVYLEFDYGPHGFDFFTSAPEAQVSTRAIDVFLSSTI